MVTRARITWPRGDPASAGTTRHGRLAAIRAGLAVLVPAGLQCGSAPPPVVVAPRPPTPAVASSRGVSLLPERVPAWIAGTGRDGSTAAVMGSLRVVLGPARVDWGTDRFASPIARALQLARAWVFVARDGTIAAADDFLGPLRRLGAVAPGSRLVAWPHGALTVVEPSGSVSLTDGATPLQPLRTPDEGRVLDAAFLDASQGALVAEGGSLFRSNDGGATWQRVDLGAEAAWRLAVGAAGLAVQTTAGARTLARDGTVSPRGEPLPPDAPPTPVPLPAADEARLRTALQARFPILAPPVPSGTPGAERSRAAPTFLSDDRRHAVAFGRCNDTGPEAMDPDWGDDPAQGTLCALNMDTEHWRPIPFGGTGLRLLGLHGAGLLLSADPQDPDDLGLHVLDTEHRTDLRLRLQAAAGPHPRLRSASWSSDGLVVGMALVAVQPGSVEAGRPRPGPALFFGRPGEALALRALPDGVESAGFIDRQHGVAAGADIGHLWRTQNGGCSWDPLQVPLTGAAKAITFATAGEAGVPTLRCSAAGCAVGERVWVQASSAPPVAAGSVLAPLVYHEEGPPPEEVALAATPQEAGFTAGRYTCVGAAQPMPSLLRLGPAGRQAPLRHEVSTAGANGVLTARGTRQGVMLQFHWRGADDTGAFSGATRAAEIAVDERDRDTMPWIAPRYGMWAAGRNGALLERCIEVRGAPSCQVLWATAGQPLQVVPDLTSFGAALRLHVGIESAMPAPGGGFAVLASAHDPDTGALYDMVSVLDAQGHVAARRAFVFATPRVHALARLQGALGYAVAKPDDPRAFRFHPLDPRGTVRSLGFVTGDRIGLCAAAADPDAAEVFLGSAPYVPELFMNVHPRPVFQPGASLEIGPRRACLRSIVSWPQMRGAGSRLGAIRANAGVRLTVGTNGRLGGFWDDGSVTQIVNCNGP